MIDSMNKEMVDIYKYENIMFTKTAAVELWFLCMQFPYHPL